MTHIKKMKTWYGTKYAVVAPSEVFAEDSATKKLVPKTEYHAVEYKTGKSNKDIKVAIFPLTSEGLKQAKEVQRVFNK